MNTPLAAAIGWTLLHSLWQAGSAAAALAVVLLATRSPRVRYASACVALLLTTAAFFFTFAGAFPLEAVPLPANPAPGLSWRLAANLTTPFFESRSLDAIAPLLAPIWAAGVCLVYLRQIAAWSSVARLRRVGVCAPPSPWLATLVRLSRSLRLARPVQLLESSLVNAPLLLGHFRPLILLPAGLLTSLPADQIEAILLHELAHVRRGDFLVNVLQRLIEGLLFYHPAVWWISHVIRTEREHLCDDLAVSASGNALAYARALAELEHFRSSGREPALAATGGNLMKRIRRLLYPNNSHAIFTPVLAALLLLAAAAAALTAWQTESSPFLNWLNQDVVYIIDDQERAAFLKLASDPEREKFIEQFWLRRDPTPGTPRNEAKEEHYRRIAYANKRFPTPARLGWQTDRGHMYIVYGPPDELESHPKGGAIAFPYEMWKYRHLQGIGDNLFFTFIDRSGSGDYRLAPGNAH